jgi:hypothetical protein
MTGFISRLLLVALFFLATYPLAPDYIQTVASFIIGSSAVGMGFVLLAVWFHRRKTAGETT